MYLFFARVLPYAVRETVYSLVFSAMNVIKTSVFTVSVSDSRDTISDRMNDHNKSTAI